MKEKATQEQIDKLPKWARNHIKYLGMERDAAVRALNEYIDEQTKSAFSVTDNICSGEEKGPSRKVRYIQTYKMEKH